MDRRHPPPASRRLVIRPFADIPAPPTDLSSSWSSMLLPAVMAIFGSKPISESHEHLYAIVNDACIHKLSPKLFNFLRETCDNQVKHQIAQLATGSVGVDTYLAAVNSVWSLHCTQMGKIRMIFLYLDRSFVIHGGVPGIRSFWDLGLAMFKKHFATTKQIESNTVKALLSIINRHRDGEVVNTRVLKSVLYMFSAIGTYQEVFEEPFLDATDEYYAIESKRCISEMDIPRYLKYAERRMQEEIALSKENFAERTLHLLVAKIEKRIVADHVDTILEKGFQTMCEEKRNNDIKRCFTVLACANSHSLEGAVTAHEKMRVQLSKYVVGVGRTIVLDYQKDSMMVHELLALKHRLDELVRSSFKGAEAFNNAVNSAFSKFVNLRENKPAELIAKFVDSVLRTGNKGFSEEELELTLDKALTLFRFIDGRDVFEAFYKKDLAKRLLYDKSASLDLEKSMISKLKAECGSQFTSKLEAMFRDVDSSKDLMHSFQSHAASQQRLGDAVGLNVFVLEAARWPLSSPKMEIKLPQSLITCQEVFKTFYLTKHNGRKITWQHVDGSCVVMARFPKGSKILNLSLYQTVVTLLFNDKTELSYAKIEEATAISKSDLKRTLLSLACGKVRILQKRPKGPRVSDTDTFVFNKLFEHKSTRIKINAIQLKETVEENKATKERVFQERNCQIDAAIVRIMKTRRTQNHTGLIGEVFNQLRFPHKPLDVKKRIESLIEREYLERDTANAQTYHYLA